MEPQSNVLPSEYDQTVRSIQSIELGQFVVSNSTERPVEVLWIDFQSKLIPYAILRSGEQTHMNAFKTHPLIFRDYCTGFLMHVENKEIFWPEPSTEQRRIQRISIHNPLHSLRILSLWAMVLRLKNFSDISQMELPRTLASELETLFHKFLNHRMTLVRNIIGARQWPPNQWILYEHRIGCSSERTFYQPNDLNLCIENYFCVWFC